MQSTYEWIVIYKSEYFETVHFSPAKYVYCVNNFGKYHKFFSTVLVLDMKKSIIW